MARQPQSIVTSWDSDYILLRTHTHTTNTRPNVVEISIRDSLQSFIENPWRTWALIGKRVSLLFIGRINNILLYYIVVVYMKWLEINLARSRPRDGMATAGDLGIRANWKFFTALILLFDRTVQHIVTIFTLIIIGFDRFLSYSLHLFIDWNQNDDLTTNLVLWLF